MKDEKFPFEFKLKSRFDLFIGLAKFVNHIYKVIGKKILKDHFDKKKKEVFI